MDLFLRRKGRDLAISKGAISPRTMESYRYRLEEFARWLLARRDGQEPVSAARAEQDAWEDLLATLDVTSITSDDVADYLFSCQQDGISAPTINARLYTIRSFFKELGRAEELSVVDVTKNVPRARYRYQRKPSVTREHMGRFMDHLESHADESKNTFRNWVLFNTIRLFGLRIGEALALKTTDVHFVDFGIKLEILGKGNKLRVRTLPLTDPEGRPVDAAHAYRAGLEKYLEEIRPKFKVKPGEEKTLFLSQAGNRFNEDSARVAFNKAMTVCQLQMHHYTPHSLRHAFVSHKLADGVPLQTVSRLVDHANVAITSSIYAHSEERDLVEGMSRGLDRREDSPEDS